MPTDARTVHARELRTSMGGVCSTPLVSAHLPHMSPQPGRRAPPLVPVVIRLSGRGAQAGEMVGRLFLPQQTWSITEACQFSHGSLKSVTFPTPLLPLLFLTLQPWPWPSRRS